MREQWILNSSRGVDMDCETMIRRMLLQRLFVDVGLGLESIENSARYLMSDLPENDPRRREGERIRTAIAALHRLIADGAARFNTSVK